MCINSIIRKQIMEADAWWLNALTNQFVFKWILMSFSSHLVSAAIILPLIFSISSTASLVNWIYSEQWTRTDTGWVKYIYNIYNVFACFVQFLLLSFQSSVACISCSCHYFNFILFGMSFVTIWRILNLFRFSSFHWMKYVIKFLCLFRAKPHTMAISNAYFVPSFGRAILFLIEREKAK